MELAGLWPDQRVTDSACSGASGFPQVREEIIYGYFRCPCLEANRSATRNARVLSRVFLGRRRPVGDLHAIVAVQCRRGYQVTQVSQPAEKVM